MAQLYRQHVLKEPGAPPLVQVQIPAEGKEVFEV
jgi:hypothetical protein